MHLQSPLQFLNESNSRISVIISERLERHHYNLLYLTVTKVTIGKNDSSETQPRSSLQTLICWLLSELSFSHAFFSDNVYLSNTFLKLANNISQHHTLLCRNSKNTSNRFLASMHLLQLQQNIPIHFSQNHRIIKV